LEDQFRVGDVIRVEETEGTVERISLRACNVRDAQGRLWVVPNGDIRFVSNATRDWSRAIVDLNLELTADINLAVAVLQAAATQAAQEPALQELLLEAPIVEGFTAINDWAVQVRVKAMTQAGGFLAKPDDGCSAKRVWRAPKYTRCSGFHCPTRDKSPLSSARCTASSTAFGSARFGLCFPRSW